MYQCEMALNMLRRLRINPEMSAYPQLFGLFAYNRTANADYGKVGYVIGPSSQHY